MTDFTLRQKSFLTYDTPTRLRHLAANLSEIKTLCVEGVHQESILNLVKQSRYFIEWTVPDMVHIDIDQAAELVDLGRVLTRWLYNWDKIWSDSKEKATVIQQAQEWLKRVVEIAQMQPESVPTN